MDTQPTEDMEGMQEIVVVLGDEEHRRKGRFTGRWLIDPDDEISTVLDGYCSDLRWGIALSDKGSIVVYLHSPLGDRTPELNVYDSIEDADGEVPGDILSMAAEAMGQQYPYDLDI